MRWILALALAVGCASGEGEPASGECPKPADGLYRMTFTVGTNTCGAPPGTTMTSDIFVSDMSSAGCTVTHLIEEPSTCSRQMEIVCDKVKLTGRSTVLSATHFRFVGTATITDTFDSCTANVTYDYRKQ